MFLDVVASNGSNPPAKGNHLKSSCFEPSTEDEYLASCLVHLRYRTIENSEKPISVFFPTVDDESEAVNKKQAMVVEQSEDNFANTFGCSVCGKAFPTHQDLNLHETIHRNKRIRVNSKGEDNNNSNINKSYICGICGMCFKKGQSLGGHMRCHYEGPISGSSRKKYQKFDLKIFPKRKSELEPKPELEPEPELDLEVKL